jgi:hypothetical protein
MTQELSTVGRLQVIYSEMNEVYIYETSTLLSIFQVDQNFVIEIATNSIRAQEKGEQAKFFKNIAQIVKQELDSQKG